MGSQHKTPPPSWTEQRALLGGSDRTKSPFCPLHTRVRGFVCESKTPHTQFFLLRIRTMSTNDHTAMDKEPTVPRSNPPLFTLSFAEEHEPEAMDVIDLTDDSVVFPKAELHAFAERYSVLSPFHVDNQGNMYKLDRTTIQRYGEGTIGIYRLIIDLTDDAEDEEVEVDEAEAEAEAGDEDEADEDDEDEVEVEAEVEADEVAFVTAFMNIQTPDAASPVVQTSILQTPNQVLMNDDIVTGGQFTDDFVYKPVYHFPIGHNLIHELNML